jgi:protein-disulfide isomerase
MDIRRPASVLASCLLSFCSSAFAAADGSQLELPRGAEVAIVVFEDLQCPDCAKAHPKLQEAARTNEVPLVIHDYPIPRHKWAFDAAVFARYFGSESPALGDQFRSFIYENQPSINPDNLRQHVEQFAQAHQVQLPADVDPDGTLKAQVQADFDLGRQIHLEYVPLIFVIGPGKGSPRSVEVSEPEGLGAVIAQMKQGSAQ